jgi:steroid delta-isomerase-like uncharacterized protein
MPRQSTITPPQQLIDLAKAPILAFNEKDWDAVKASISRDFVYDEVATNRQARGAEEVIPLWQGWATAFPDARATFQRELVCGNTVILEQTWRGTHKGALPTPAGPIPATGNRIEIRACMVVEVSGEKATMQRHYFDMATMLQQLGVDGGR